MVYRRKIRRTNLQVLTACLDRLLVNNDDNKKAVIDEETHKVSIENAPIEIDKINEKKKKIPYIKTILLMNKISRT